MIYRSFQIRNMESPSSRMFSSYNTDLSDIEQDTEEEDSDTTNNDQTFSAEVLQDIDSHRIQLLWKEQLETSPNMEDIQSLIRVDQNQTTAITNPLRINGTDKSSFQRQLLAQFCSPLSRSDQRALWLDPEFALYLRGQAVIAQHSTSDLKKMDLARGLRLISSTSSSLIIKSLVRALSQSLQSRLVFLNRRTVDNVRRAANQRYALPSTTLTAESIIKELFQLLHSSPEEPCVVCLHDEMEWYLRVPGVSAVLHRELALPKSRLFFIQAEPEPPLPVGYSPETGSTRRPGPGSSFSVSSPSEPSSVSQPVDTAMSPPHPQFPPGFPPMSPAQLANMPPPVGQSFQITIKNGTASVSEHSLYILSLLLLTLLTLTHYCHV